MESPNSSPIFPQLTFDNNSDHFIVEDLLDFSNDDVVITDTTFGSVTTDSSAITTAVESCNSSSFSGANPNTVPDIGSRNLSDGHFSDDLCVPYDDIAELEWLSNFVEESFSNEDLQKMHLISGMNAPNDNVSEAREFHYESTTTRSGPHTPEPTSRSVGLDCGPTRNSPIFNSEVSVPAKARSKRSRGPPCNWASRLLVLSPTSSSSDNEVVVPSLTTTEPGPSPAKKRAKFGPRKKDSNSSDGNGSGGDERRCLHCATDKTPQWRTGPMGPKTLCNACGVRYKSGRLVPEYRPAASPTFVVTKHSNSHRKVMELRRQKEMVRSQQHHQQHQQQFLQHHQHQHHQNMMFDVSNGDEYLIHQHVGPDFRQLM